MIFVKKNIEKKNIFLNIEIVLLFFFLFNVIFLYKHLNLKIKKFRQKNMFRQTQPPVYYIEILLQSNISPLDTIVSNYQFVKLNLTEISCFDVSQYYSIRQFIKPSTTNTPNYIIVFIIFYGKEISFHL